MVVFIRIHWEPPFSLDPLVQADNDHRLDEFMLRKLDLRASLVDF